MIYSDFAANHPDSKSDLMACSRESWIKNEPKGFLGMTI
jgi:hypothetical protein